MSALGLDRWRARLGAAYLGLQVLSVTASFLVPSKYFGWAMYDSNTAYAIRVVIGGRTLTAEEVLRRYRVKAEGSENRSIQHKIDAIRQFERTLGARDRAEVTMRYRVDGGPEVEWRWPE